MKDPRAFFEQQVPSRIHQIQDVLPRGVSVAFHIEGSGGGAWQVDSLTPAVGPVTDDRKDCEIRCSSDSFMALLSGDLSPQDALRSGQIRVTGDVGLLLKLRRMFLRAA